MNKKYSISKEDYENRKYDLEERLIQFALNILEIAERLPNTYTGRYFGNQLTRCGTSPAFHYSEAKSAESRKDFVHKLKVGLKELRESSTNMKIIKRKPLLKDSILDKTLKECEELISILLKAYKPLKEIWAKIEHFDIPCLVFNIQYSFDMNMRCSRRMNFMKL